MAEPNALRLALQALGRRELSAQELAVRLRRAGVSEDETAEVLAYLREAGLQRDARAAAERARVLAARGLGDGAIKADLRRRGLHGDEVEAALGELSPERERVALVGRDRSPEALARFLRARGYSAETIDGVLDAVIADGS